MINEALVTLTDPVPPDIEAVLDAIEVREMHSLVWGFVDGSLSGEEVRELIRDVTGSAEARAILDELVEKTLLHRVDPGDGSARYRSRFAETIRLLVRLRQLFPNRRWFEAPQLVSDFRIERRPRRYPRRDLNPGELLRALRGDGLIRDPLRAEGWHALVDGLALAGFQERAIRRLLERKGNSATIITAGTGSGKTLAFYLPVLLQMLSKIDETRWVKTISLYPRNELLKDQLAEAYRLARKLDEPLRRSRRRPLSIGALFGTTPRDANDAAEKWNGHPSRRRDRVCPFMPCPECGEQLLWVYEDRVRERERLTCAAPDCGVEIGSEYLVLTRKTLLDHRPDLLFTTMEMLNRRLSDTRARRLFGVDVPRVEKPLAVLLDEVHTYVGTTGAQGALTLRRYRHLLRSETPFTGLSATLAEAERFFAELVGVEPSLVAEITPDVTEMVEERAEYQLILRGDPSSQIALLSTTIQAAMLMGRAMDPAGGGASEGRYGERVFIFSDALDSTNRLFDDLRSAEGLTIFGKRDQTKSPLAVLRGGGSDTAAKDVYGQRWALCEEIGRPLADPLAISRTTSQDTGVNAEADIVVATASLEVGFNDPGVGAVLQHKAPMNAASFLQRKGRAGRSRAMRPYTITVLSDYGRDRITFQTFEHLFDPVLPAQQLPIKNEYVLRIHAVFALLEWLANRLADAHQVWMWDALSHSSGRGERARASVVETLQGLVRGDGTLLADLRQFLVGALQVDSAGLESILWSPPRPLLLEAVPTLLRRLVRDWRLARRVGTDIQVPFHPLPDFVPQTLFGELNLPEVTVMLPPATVIMHESRESLPIALALRELAPGRVTRRFAHQRGGLSHWFPVGPGNSYDLPIGEYCELADPLGTFGSIEPTEVYRPWRIRLVKTPKGVMASSHSVLTWRTELIAQGEALVVEVPVRSSWRAYVGDVRFHLHRFGSSVLVRRYAPEAQASVKEHAGSRTVRVRFTANGASAAIGFEFEADGFYLDIALPDAGALAPDALPAELRAACGTAYFRNRILTDSQLPEDANVFHRDWLYQILVSAAVVRASTMNESIGTAGCAVADDANALKRAMVVMFSVQDPITAHEESDELVGEVPAEATIAEDESEKRARRLQDTLAELIDRPELRLRLADLACELDEPNPAAWDTWMRETLLQTLGEALLQACTAAAPRHTATDTLLVDVEDGGDGAVRIWVTETTLGGAGVIQEFAKAFAEEPRALFRAVEAALAPTDLELAADGLERFLAISAKHPEIAQLAKELRAALGHEERDRLRRALWHGLAGYGLDVPRALAVSLDARLLRAGAANSLNATLSDLLERWKELEARLGISIELRAMSQLAASDHEIAAAVRELVREAAPSVPTVSVNVAQALSALLWPRAVEVRRRSLDSYNPYRTRKPTDPALVRHFFVDERVPEIAAGEPGWHVALIEALQRHGTARLRADAGTAATLRAALLEMTTEPIVFGYVRLFATLERVERDGPNLVATLSVREAV